MFYLVFDILFDKLYIDHEATICQQNCLHNTHLYTLVQLYSYADNSNSSYPDNYAHTVHQTFFNCT